MFELFTASPGWTAFMFLVAVCGLVAVVHTIVEPFRLEKRAQITPEQTRALQGRDNGEG
jgi:hypothetical protein